MGDSDQDIGEHPDVHTSPAVQTMEEKANEIHERIGQMHKELTKLQNADESPGGGVDPLTIEQETIKQLKAEIETEKNRKIEAPPQDTVVLYALLKDELKQSISQLQFTAAAVRSHKRELKERIEREKEVFDEHRQIKTILEQKTVEAVNSQVVISEVSYKKGLSEKETEAKKYLRQVMKWLLQFVSTHYPPPTAEQTAKWRRRNRRERDDDINPLELIPLETILEELMNKAIESPHDPYIDVEQGHWPPYVELLLRCGIALKHPELDNRIKMTPYHY